MDENRNSINLKYKGKIFIIQPKNVSFVFFCRLLPSKQESKELNQLCNVALNLSEITVNNIFKLNIFKLDTLSNFFKVCNSVFVSWINYFF